LQVCCQSADSKSNWIAFWSSSRTTLPSQRAAILRNTGSLQPPICVRFFPRSPKTGNNNSLHRCETQLSEVGGWALHSPPVRPGVPLTVSIVTVSQFCNCAHTRGARGSNHVYETRLSSAHNFRLRYQINGNSLYQQAWPWPHVMPDAPQTLLTACAIVAAVLVWSL